MVPGVRLVGIEVFGLRLVERSKRAFR